MEQQNFNSMPQDYILSVYETCELLGKSSRTISRYVHSNILHPVGIKSRQGTLEYRFSRAEVDRLREKEKATRPYVFLDNNKDMEPDYAAANFADYACPPSLARPKQPPFLIPGISFPVRKNQNEPQAPMVWPPNGPQNFNPQSQDFNLSPDESLCRRKPGRPSRSQNAIKESKNEIKINEPAVPSAQIKEAQDRGNVEIISLLKETTEMLRGQLKTKDDQIKNLDDKIGQLIERNRETNILLKGLQDKIMLLEKPKAKRDNDNRSEMRRSGESLPETEVVSPKVSLRKDENEVRETAKTVNSFEGSLLKNPDTADGANYGLPIPPAKSAPAGKEAGRVESEKKGLFGKIFG